MKLLASHAGQMCLLVIAVAMALPAAAGGVKSKPGVHQGHGVNRHGGAGFHRKAPRLTNGVHIFRREMRGLPNGVSIFNRRPQASPVHADKVNKRKRPGQGRGDAKRPPKPHGKMKKQRHARKDSDRGSRKKTSKRKHKRHGKGRVIPGSVVYVARPYDEYVYPEDPDGEDCRHLTERGYDLSGRRVLLEWTLCFDEQGEAYVPSDSPRILARY